MNKRTSRTISRRVLAALLIFALAAPAARAEEARSSAITVRLAIGSRARIILDGPSTTPLTGTVRAMDESSITIDTSGGATIRTPRREIRSLQVSVEQRRNTVKGALIGAGIMAALGAAACSPTNSSSYYYSCDSRAAGAVLLGIGGAFWGGLLGYRTRSEQWTDVPLTQEAFLAPQDVAQPPAPGPPSPAAAARLQPPAPLANVGSRLFAGARIRVHHGGQKTEGLLIDISPSAVIIAASAGTVSVPRQTVGLVETWGGEKKRAVRGALIGLLAGAVLDFTSEPYCTTNGAPLDTSVRDCSRLASATETAAGGAIIGAGIGLLVKKTTWTPVSLTERDADLPRSSSGDLAWQISPVLPRNGHGAGLRLRLAW